MVERRQKTLANSVFLCYACNKLQGRDSWTVFLRKQGAEDTKVKELKSVKESLQAMSISQLKFLAKKHNIVVKGEVVEDWLNSYRKAPTKSQYIKKLSGKLAGKDLRSVPKEAPKPVKKKRRKKSSNSWW